MSKKILRFTVLIALTGVVCLSAMSLLAGPTDWQRSGPDRVDRPTGGQKFYPCPWPPCMAPCQYPPQPEVLCLAPDGTRSVTSWTCCCCGGGSASYRWLGGP